MELRDLLDSNFRVLMGGCIASILASHPVAPGSILVIPENFDVAGIHQQRYREESRQRLDNIDWTHLAL